MSLLKPLAILGGKAIGGITAGYGSSMLSGSDYDFGRDGVMDAGLGMLALPGGPSTRSYSRFMPSFLGGQRGFNSARILGKVGAGAMIPFRQSYSQSIPPTQNFSLGTSPTSGRPFYGPAVPAGLFQPKLPTVEAVPINFTPGQAPQFNKTLADFLADKQLQGQVNQSIFAANKPMLEANKQEKVNSKRNRIQNNQIGRGIQDSYEETIAKQIAANAQNAAEMSARRDLMEKEVAEAEGQVPITYMQGEASKARAERDEFAAKEENQADSLIARLAQDGQDYINKLREAEASQTRVNDQAIKQRHVDAIRGNAAQIRTNQAQRGSLLGTLASEQYKNAIDLYNTSVQNFNAAEDRRYQQAAADAQIQYDANKANVEARLEASMPAGDGKEHPEIKAARDRYDKINMDISKMKYETTKDPRTGEMVPLLETPEGKKKIAQARHERDRLMEKYGFGTG